MKTCNNLIFFSRSMSTRDKEFKIRTDKKSAAENTWPCYKCTVYQIQEDLRTHGPKETKYEYSNRLRFRRSLDSFPEQRLVIEPTFYLLYKCKLLGQDSWWVVQNWESLEVQGWFVCHALLGCGSSEALHWWLGLAAAHWLRKTNFSYKSGNSNLSVLENFHDISLLFASIPKEKLPMELKVCSLLKLHHTGNKNTTKVTKTLLR